MAERKSIKTLPPAGATLSADDISCWKERLEAARVQAATAESLVKFKYEIRASKQEDNGNLAWYSDFHNGVIDDAVRYLACGAESELQNAVQWLESLAAREVAHHG